MQKSPISTLAELLSNTRASDNVYTPTFLDLTIENDSLAFAEILSTPGVHVYDTIYDQLKELIKMRDPSITYSQDMIANEITTHLSGTPQVEHGLWVYYPWSKKLAHVLPRNEFIELRTNRNKYKITEAERNILETKRIGVIGLSVGQSVSLTLAMERTFGQLRIADFDTLEITNLNRLRSGIHNMGLKKTVVVAREIAEIDPYLDVVCYHEGINDSNIEQFLTKDGKLDMLIDECDSVDIKIGCRIEARKHGIPVLMEASDRGTVDIERYDLDPSYPILHGAVAHLDLAKLKELKTSEEKLPYMLPIVGLETMSPRLKASSVEIGQSIATWPQLASAVTLGGGITADVCRRILLDQLHVSGRFFVDLEKLICDPVKPQAEEQQVKTTDTLTREKMQQYADEIKINDTKSLQLDIDTITRLVDAARVAPSAGNNQPWKWFCSGKQLLLFICRSRTAIAGGIYDTAAYLSLGAAIENLRLKAIEMGMTANARLFPLKGNDELLCSVNFYKHDRSPKDDLVNFIGTRYTNRNAGNQSRIPAADIQAIKSASATSAPVKLKIIDDPKSLSSLAEIIGKAEKLRIFIQQGHKELFESEIRWTPESAEATKDGVDIRSLELSLKDTAGLMLLKDPDAMKLVSEWNAGSTIEKLSRDMVSSSSAMGLLTVPALSAEMSVNAGIAMERVWLAATRAGLAVQPFFAPIQHFAMIRSGKGHDMPPAVEREFHKLYTQFASTCDLNTEEEAIFLFRFSYATEVKVKSLRLDRKDTFFVGSR